MINKSVAFIAAVSFPVIILAAWCGVLHYQNTTSQTVKIAVQGYDPKDILSGHYLNLRPDWRKTDCSQFPNNICPQEKFNTSYRYFLEEQSARKLDKLITAKQPELTLELTWKQGKTPQIKQLFIESLPWQTWLQQQE